MYREGEKEVEEKEGEGEVLEKNQIILLSFLYPEL